MSLRVAIMRALNGSTAEIAACIRAVAALRSEPPRGPDHLAVRLIPRSAGVSALVKVPGVDRVVSWILARALPGVFPFEMVRTGYMDQVVREEVAAGATQLVLLGAGLDSRAYRMDELAGMRVFEVDQQAMSGWKQDRVRAVLGELPPSVRYVGADLNVHSLETALTDAGYDPRARTVVVWSGVAPYLEPSAVDEALRWMSRQAPESCLVFDHLWQEVLDGTATTPMSARLVWITSALGEPFLSAIPQRGSADFLAERGLSVVEQLVPDVARNRFLRRTDGTFLEPLLTAMGLFRVQVPRGSASS